MFENLLANIYRAQAESDFEFARITDPYRLMYLLNKKILTLKQFYLDADELVRELEG